MNLWLGFWSVREIATCNIGVIWSTLGVRNVMASKKWRSMSKKWRCVKILTGGRKKYGSACGSGGWGTPLRLWVWDLEICGQPRGWGRNSSGLISKKFPSNLFQKSWFDTTKSIDPWQNHQHNTSNPATNLHNNHTPIKRRHNYFLKMINVMASILRNITPPIVSKTISALCASAGSMYILSRLKGASVTQVLILNSFSVSPKSCNMFVFHIEGF